MIRKLLTILIALLAGLGYFVLGFTYWTLIALLLVTLATRFRTQTREVGKFAEMVFAFLLTWFVINEFDIGYPYQLIMILAALVVIIFYEGPEWGELYFTFGTTRNTFRAAMGIMALMSLAFGGWVYVNFETITNPAPYLWPVDVAVIAGIGFALYVALMHEVLFRSFIHERAVMAAGSTPGLVAQAVLYGLMFYRLPVTTGFSGVVLGSALGLALGYLVKKSNSIYLSVFVNFVVSLVVFLELVFLGKIQAS